MTKNYRLSAWNAVSQTISGHGYARSVMKKTPNSIQPTENMYAGSKKPDIEKIIVEDFYDLDGLPFEQTKEEYDELEVY
jgi:hypothetical protein